jgi:Trp operon repressor
MGKRISKVSDFNTRNGWKTAAWNQLIDSLANSNAEDLRKIVELITSPYERNLMTIRAAVLERLDSGESYREIGRELWVSPTMISWIKKGLNTKKYTSSWEKVKVDTRINQIKKSRAKERPWPNRYRQTKYGRLRIH